MKRIDVVSIKMVKESCINYEYRFLDRPEKVLQLFRDFVGEIDRECLVLICLNTKNMPTHIQVVSIGSLSASIVHPREVMKTSILANASSIIIAHNHPSGDVKPSSEDNDITTRIVKACEIIGIKFLDHLIVGDNCYFSYKEDGRV